jgi:hypothetical protein
MSGEGSTGAPPPGPERRATPRHPSNLKVVCYPAGAGLTERRQVRLRDVSRGGLGLLTDRRWGPGTNLIFELWVRGALRTARARVVHATSHLGGSFLIGCAFDIPLTESELHAFTSPELPERPPE